jgi:hypothetical protein
MGIRHGVLHSNFRTEPPPHHPKEDTSNNYKKREPCCRREVVVCRTSKAARPLEVGQTGGIAFERWKPFASWLPPLFFFLWGVVLVNCICANLGNMFLIFCNCSIMGFGHGTLRLCASTHKMSLFRGRMIET